MPQKTTAKTKNASGSKSGPRRASSTTGTAAAAMSSKTAAAAGASTNSVEQALPSRLAGSASEAALSTRKIPEQSETAAAALVVTAAREGAPADTEEQITETLARLEQLRRETQAELDATSDIDYQSSLNDLLDAISDANTDLNRESIAQHTVSLQAAEQQLQPAIDALEHLQGELQQIADTIDTAARIAAAVDGIVTGIRGVLTSFGG